MTRFILSLSKGEGGYYYGITAFDENTTLNLENMHIWVEFGDFCGNNDLSNCGNFNLSHV